MGFLDRVRAFLRGEASTPLVDYPETFREAALETLGVHTANVSPESDEVLVILTVSSVEPFSLLDAPLSLPLRLTSTSSRAVTFVPVDAPADPALDPNLGWIIPVTADTAAELAALPARPGEYELRSLHLGVVVTSAADAAAPEEAGLRS